MEQQYILKRPWRSKSGIQEELYLGYNENNRLDCISDLPKAKQMSQKECEEFKSILTNSKVWVVDVLPEDFNKEEIKNIEENTNEQSTNN